jgi:hypothetical protein
VKPVVLWAGPSKPPKLDFPHDLALWERTPDGFAMSAFQRMAGELTKSHGSPLRGALALKGINPDTRQPIAIGGFSAGGGLLRAILANDSDRVRVLGAGFFDATYCRTERPPRRGYLEGAKRAASGHMRMVVTSSRIPGNAKLGLPSATACMQAVANAVGAIPTACLSIGPARCVQAAATGDLRWYAFGDRESAKQTHLQHATVLAPALFPGVVPRGTDTTQPSSGGAGALLLGGGLLWAAGEAFDIWR